MRRCTLQGLYSGPTPRECVASFWFKLAEVRAPVYCFPFRRQIVMGLGSSLETLSVSQGSIKCCFVKSKTRRHFFPPCLKHFLQAVLSVWVLFPLPACYLMLYQTALLALFLSQTQLCFYIALCLGKWCKPMCR